MRLTKFDIILTIIFCLILIIGAVGSFIVKRFKSKKEIVQDNEPELIDKQYSEEQTEALIEDMAENLIKDEDYIDKDDSINDYIEY